MSEYQEGLRGTSPATRSVVWLTTERAIQLLNALAIGVVIARSLGPTEFGVYVYAIAFVGLALPLVQVGQGVVVQELVFFPDKRRQILGTALAANALVAAVAGGVVVLAGAVMRLPSPRVPTLVAIGLTGIAIRPLLVLDYEFQARQWARPASMARTSAMAIAAIAKIAVVFEGGGLVALSVATAVEQPLAAVLLYRAYRKAGLRLSSWEFERKTMRRIFSRSWPLAVATFSISIYLRIDQVMLGSMSTLKEGGLYAAATRVSEAMYFIPVAVVAAVAPSVARAKLAGESGYNELLETLLAYLALTAMAYTVLVLAVAPVLVGMLFGSDYSGATSILRLHVLSAVFVFVGTGASVWTINEGKERLAMYRALSGAVVNIAINLLLIPRYGGMAAAFATLVSYALASMLFNALSSSTQPIFVLQLASFRIVRSARLVGADIRLRASRSRSLSGSPV